MGNYQQNERQNTSQDQQRNPSENQRRAQPDPHRQHGQSEPPVHPPGAQQGSRGAKGD